MYREGERIWRGWRKEEEKVLGEGELANYKSQHTRRKEMKDPLPYFALS